MTSSLTCARGRVGPVSMMRQQRRFDHLMLQKGLKIGDRVNVHAHESNMDVDEVSTTASSQGGVDRRLVLTSSALGMAGVILGSMSIQPPPAEAKLVDKTIKSSALSAFQRRDLLVDFQMRAEKELKNVLTASDAPACMRLLIHDAATYNAMEKSGGVNGSIVYSEELNRPVNSDLKSLVEKLGKAREAVKKNGPPSQAMLSWADTIVLAAKVSTELSWNKEKQERLSANNQQLAEKFGNPFEITLGRLDSDNADPDVSIPKPGSSPADVRAFMSTLGVQDPSQLGGPLSKKAPFWERPTFLLWTASENDPGAAETAFGADSAFQPWKAKYDKSRDTTFRQDYEIDFVQFFNKLAGLGARFDKNVYLYDIVMKVPDRL